MDAGPLPAGTALAAAAWWGCLNDALAASPRSMAGFRNVLVHAYEAPVSRFVRR